MFVFEIVSVFLLTVFSRLYVGKEIKQRSIYLWLHVHSPAIRHPSCFVSFRLSVCVSRALQHGSLDTRMPLPVRTQNSIKFPKETGLFSCQYVDLSLNYEVNYTRNAWYSILQYMHKNTVL